MLIDRLALNLKTLDLKIGGGDDNIICPVCKRLCRYETDNDNVYEAPTFERCPNGHYEVMCYPDGVRWDEFFAKGFNIHRNMGGGCTLITAPSAPQPTRREDIYHTPVNSGEVLRSVPEIVTTARICATIAKVARQPDTPIAEVEKLLLSDGKTAPTSGNGGGQ